MTRFIPSLHCDFSRSYQGDCVVTFSCNSIFALKKRGRNIRLLRAVAYEKLPPKIRSEQAVMFSDLNSRYDVIVASDVIGIGLDLKIKGVVFESITSTAT